MFWVAGPWQGRLGILPRPRGGDWLGDEMTAWRETGIDMVISLLEPDEEAQLVLEGEAAAAAAAESTSGRFPFRTGGARVPTVGCGTRQRNPRCARRGKERGSPLSSGHRAFGADHQWCSCGRRQGSRLALKAIRESRGLEVPETEEQRRWLSDLASGW